jgi:small subunit ribosomal protein S20
MAHHKSALTRIRRNARRTAINKNRVSSMRTEVRKVEDAIAAGDKKAAAAALKSAEPALAKNVRRGVIHANAASRKVSRLSARIKAMSAR